MMWPKNFDKMMTGDFAAEKPSLSVTEIAWGEYPGATDEDKVVYAIEAALRKIPSGIREKIDKITIDRNAP